MAMAPEGFNDVQDEKGRTPAMLAAQKGKLKEFVAGGGIITDQQDKRGQNVANPTSAIRG
jgi:hypothetical protein